MSRLKQEAPLDETVVSALRELHHVDLTAIKDDEGFWWLICRDTGAGMSREILMNYLLVSGAGRHPDLFELARRCKEAGFDLERTGKFGIGVLSYFMIADRLELRTRRCLEALGGEAEAWAFSTDGVGAFGELRRDHLWSDGTEVRLRLRPGVTDPATLGKRLAEMLVRTPCRTTYAVDGNDASHLTLPSGWTTTQDQLTERYVRHARELWTRSDKAKPENDYMADQDREYQEFLVEKTEAELDELPQRVSWLSVVGRLQDLGEFRLEIPLIASPIGPLLALFRFVEEDGNLLLGVLGGGRVVRPSFPVTQSVGGSTVNEHIGSRWEHRRDKPYVLHVDWTSPKAGVPLASRDEIRLSAIAKKALAEVDSV